MSMSMSTNPTFDIGAQMMIPMAKRGGGVRWSRLSKPPTTTSSHTRRHPGEPPKKNRCPWPKPQIGSDVGLIIRRGWHILHSIIDEAPIRVSSWATARRRRRWIWWGCFLTSKFTTKRRPKAWWRSHDSQFVHTYITLFCWAMMIQRREGGGY